MPSAPSNRNRGPLSADLVLQRSEQGDCQYKLSTVKAHFLAVSLSIAFEITAEAPMLRPIPIAPKIMTTGSVNPSAAKAILLCSSGLFPFQSNLRHPRPQFSDKKGVDQVECYHAEQTQDHGKGKPSELGVNGPFSEFGLSAHIRMRKGKSEEVLAALFNV